jgi:hypothetical protein
MSKFNYEDMKKDLQNFFDDWKLLTNEEEIENPVYLKKLSEDILSLYKDAQSILENSPLKEDAELAIYLLSTPWGAPFVAECSLIEAAKNYKSENNSESKLLHLLKDFVNYTYIFNNQIYCIFEDLKEDIELEENNHEKI